MVRSTKKTGSSSSEPLYRAFDFAMVRAPLLPIERYLALGTGDEHLSMLAPTDPQIRRALAIGSPSLLDALDRAAPGDEKAARLIGKLRRFVVRMSTRPTPYGTFAGVALARWGKQTDLVLDRAPRTCTRVDMDWLVQYALRLEAQPAVRNQLRWVANSGAWVHNGRVILTERIPAPAGAPSGSVSVAGTPVVRRAFDLARTPILYSALVEELLASTSSVKAEKVERLLQQLWQLGFLRTELMPPLTIEDPTKWVRDRLAPITGGKALCVQLDALLHTIDACDKVFVEQAPSALRKATAHVSLLGKTQTEMPLQVDTALGLSGECLSSGVAEEAARVAELLLRITPVPNGPPNIEGYRQAFLARYGLDREVPLLELLHPDWGLGPVGQRVWNSGLEPTRAAQRAETLQSLALSAVRDGQLKVDLDDELLRKLETHASTSDHVPTSIDLNLFLLASSRTAIDTGEFQLMVGPNVGAPVAGRNLGRFAHLLGLRARSALDLAARHDEKYHPKHITAELAYLPRTFRTANVTVRPPVRHYEIAQNVSAGVDPEHVVPLNDLVVGVRHGRFYVRWLSRDVEVLFASGHMLNPNQASSECQLLSDIGNEGVAQLTSFDWGPASGFRFLPRVQSARSILRCAQWRLEIVAQAEAPIDRSKSFAEWFARWRERWRVPRRAYLSLMDNRLLYDLEDPAHVEDLRGELGRAQGQGQCLLQEALPGPEHAWLESAAGEHHVVELVVSLGLRRDPPKPAVAATSEKRRSFSVITSDVRTRPPGSDWLYLKLYLPRSDEDEIIGGPVHKLCGELEGMHIVEDWFFVRYADPDPHLRLRFHGTPERLTGTLFPQLCTWASQLVGEGKCHRFAFDTYEREVERYGGVEATIAAEELFAADSRAVVDLLACASRVDRVVLTVLTIDDLLDSLSLDDSARLAWLKRTVTWRKESSDEYRARRDRLMTALHDPVQFNTSIVGVLSRRRAALRQIASRLAKMELEGALTQPLSKLYESYIHMHCNRLWDDHTAERRALGLLLRTRDAIAHKRKACPDEGGSRAFSVGEIVGYSSPPLEVQSPVGEDYVG
jgi:thiopeptide-type bacteriocin biosynthesis protein